MTDQKKRTQLWKQFQKGSFLSTIRNISTFNKKWRNSRAKIFKPLKPQSGYNL